MANLIDKWLNLSKKNQVLSNFTTTTQQDNQDHLISLHKLNVTNHEDLPLPNGICFIKGKTDISHSYSVSFFDLPSKKFVGSTRGGLCLTDPIYWYSRNCNADHTILVLEFLVIQTRNDIEEIKQCCGWTILGIQKDTASSSKLHSLLIYQGTPRKLLFLGNVSSFDQLARLLPLANATVQCTLDITFPDSPQLVNNDYIFNSTNFAVKESVESIHLHDIHVSYLTILFEETTREEIDDWVCAVAVLRNKNVDSDCLTRKKKTFLQQFGKKRKDKKYNQEMRVIRRRIHFTVHNGHVPLSSTIVELATNESGGLSSVDAVVLRNYFEQELCAVVASLEFTVSLPSPKSGDENGDFHQVILGHQIIMITEDDISLCQPLERHVCLSSLFPFMDTRHATNFPGDIVMHSGMNLKRNEVASENKPDFAPEHSNGSKACRKQEIGSDICSYSHEELEDNSLEDNPIDRKHKSKVQSKTGEKEYVYENRAESMGNILLPDVSVENNIEKADYHDANGEHEINSGSGDIDNMIIASLLKDHVHGCEMQIVIGSIMIENHHDPVYCCYHFYHNPECRTMNLNDSSEHRQKFHHTFDEWGIESRNLSHYLNKGTLSIHIWCSHSLMMIGKACVPVRECLQDSFASFSIIRQNGMYCDVACALSQDKSDICGKIEIKLSVETLEAREPLILHRTIEARPMIETNTDVRNMVEDAWAALRDPSIVHSQLTSFFLAMLQQSNMGFDHSDEMIIEIIIVDWYRKENMKPFLQQHLNRSTTKMIDINIIVGHSEYLELEFSNLFEDDAQFSMSLSDSSIRFISGREAEVARSNLSPVKVIIQEGKEPGKVEYLAQTRETEQGSFVFWIRSRSTILVPLIFRVSNINHGRKDVNVHLKELKGRADYRCCFRTRITNAPIDKTFHFVGKSGSSLNQKFAMPTPRPQKIQSTLFQAVDNCNDIIVRSHYGSMNTPESFLLLLYNDKYMLSHPICWRIALYGYDVTSCVASAGQWSFSIILLDPFVGRNELLCSTNDEEHVMLNPSTIRPNSGKATEVKVSFNFKQKGSHCFVVHVVENNMILQGRLFQVTVQ
jgi:hypothetical protein